MTYPLQKGFEFVNTQFLTAIHKSETESVLGRTVVHSRT